jgi:hypothetical protein
LRRLGFTALNPIHLAAGTGPQTGGEESRESVSGRPRGRMLDCKPKRFTSASTQASRPYVAHEPPTVAALPIPLPFGPHAPTLVNLRAERLAQDATAAVLKKGSGTICARHPPGRWGKWCLTCFVENLVPTLCVGTQASGRSASRTPPSLDFTRFGTQSVQAWVPTQSVGTRIHPGFLQSMPDPFFRGCSGVCWQGVATSEACRQVVPSSAKVGFLCALF